MHDKLIIHAQSIIIKILERLFAVVSKHISLFLNEFGKLIDYTGLNQYALYIRVL